MVARDVASGGLEVSVWFVIKASDVVISHSGLSLYHTLGRVVNGGVWLKSLHGAFA